MWPWKLGVEKSMLPRKEASEQSLINLGDDISSVGSLKMFPPCTHLPIITKLGHCTDVAES